MPADANSCPICGKKSPLEIRCPTCRSPLQEGWKACPGCGQVLNIPCPKCGKQTFVDAYCRECGADMFVACPKCGAEQLPGKEKCVRCGKNMVKKKLW